MLMNNSFSVSNTSSILTIDYNALGNRIGTIIYSIIYLLGFVGNLFAMLTFSSRRMRQISSSIFLLILSISDTVALITSIWFFLADAFAIHLQNYSALACRLRTFFAYVFMDLSSWCLAGLAIDRYLRTKYPLSAKTWCTPRNAAYSITIFFLALCGINGHYFSPGIGQERGENRTTAHCLENRHEYPKYYYFYKIIWPKIDMIIFCFLPACIMILSNVNIIYLLRRQRHYIQYPTQRRSSQAVVVVPPNSPTQSFNGNSKPLRNRSSSSGQRKLIEKQMSLMMAACVIAFLLTTVPVTIYLIILERVIIRNPNFARDNAYFIFIFRILRVLMYIHFASNFYLYCLTSRFFRSEFMQSITCKRCSFVDRRESTKCVVKTY